MDLTWARVLFTLWVFVSFMLVLYFVFRRKSKSGYQEAASSIIDDEDTPNKAST